MAGFTLRIAQSSTLPLDAVRSALLRVAGRPGRCFLVDRGARVALYGSLGVACALTLTATAPLWLLALGPILLGVPHLLADVRYLVVRQGLHRRVAFWPLVAAPLALTLAIPHATSAFAGVAGASLLARGSHSRRLVVLVSAIALALLAAAGGRTADVILAHTHNVVALALWWAWSPRRGGVRWIPLALCAVATALLLGGAFDGVVQLHGVAPRSGFALETMVRALSPIGAGPWGVRAVLFFAFAQSVHYAVWLRLIPEEDRPRPGMRSFASSVQALQRDVGMAAVIACAAAVVGLGAWACIDLHAARGAYPRVALFHGPLEFAVAAILFIERRAYKAA